MEDNKMELAGNGTAENSESMNNESVNQNSVTDRELSADASAEVAEGGAAAEETLSASSDSDTPTSNGSPIDLSTVTGFKAVDANGNEIMVSKDELVNSVAENILMSLNARNGVMTLAENSTLAAAAASGTDEYENQLPVMNDCSHVRVLDSSGNPGLMTKQRNAEVVGGLLPLANADNKGLMSISNYRRMGRNFTKGYRKLAESRVWYNHYSALIYAASPASTRGTLLSVSWAGTNTSAVRLNSNNNNVKLYMGDNPETGKHELWFGMIGVDGSASEFIIAIDSEIDWNSGTTDILPSYLSEVTIS